MCHLWGTEMAPSGQKFWLPVVSTDHMEPSHMLTPVCAPLHPATLALWITCSEMTDAAGFICSHVTLLRPDSVGKKKCLVDSENPIPQSSQTTSPAEERSAQAPGPDLLGSIPDDASIYWYVIWNKLLNLSWLQVSEDYPVLYITSSCSEDKIIYF